MSIHRTQAVVLRTRKVRETSKIVVFFTRNYGKISTIAKGSLRPKSKFGASLEILTYTSIIFYKKENRELHTLSHSEILNPFRSVKEDFVKLAYASAAGELVERFMPAEEVNKQLFVLLVGTLGEFDIAKRHELEVILSSYLLKMLRLVGYGPELWKCTKCRKKVKGDAYFGVSSGGILCVSCKDRDLHPIPVSANLIDLLREYESVPTPMLRNKYSGNSLGREASELLTGFVRGQIADGTRVKSLEFLERIRQTKYA